MFLAFNLHTMTIAHLNSALLVYSTWSWAWSQRSPCSTAYFGSFLFVFLARLTHPHQCHSFSRWKPRTCGTVESVKHEFQRTILQESRVTPGTKCKRYVVKFLLPALILTFRKFSSHGTPSWVCRNGSLARARVPSRLIWQNPVRALPWRSVASHTYTAGQFCPN